MYDRMFMMCILLITVILSCLLLFLDRLWSEVRQVGVVVEWCENQAGFSSPSWAGRMAHLSFHGWTSVCWEGIKPICLTIHKVQILRVAETSGNAQHIRNVALYFNHRIFICIPARILLVKVSDASPSQPSPSCLLLLRQFIRCYFVSVCGVFQFRDRFI